MITMKVIIVYADPMALLAGHVMFRITTNAYKILVQKCLGRAKRILQTNF
jgi:hypothetical protein